MRFAVNSWKLSSGNVIALNGEYIIKYYFVYEKICHLSEMFPGDITIVLDLMVLLSDI